MPEVNRKSFIYTLLKQNDMKIFIMNWGVREKGGCSIIESTWVSAKKVHIDIKKVDLPLV